MAIRPAQPHEATTVSQDPDGDCQCAADTISVPSQGHCGRVAGVFSAQLPGHDRPFLQFYPHRWSPVISCRLKPAPTRSSHRHLAGVASGEGKNPARRGKRAGAHQHQRHPRFPGATANRGTLTSYDGQRSWQAASAKPTHWGTLLPQTVLPFVSVTVAPNGELFSTPPTVPAVLSLT